MVAYGYGASCAGYGYPVAGWFSSTGTILVLFILLVIISRMLVW